MLDWSIAEDATPAATGLDKQIHKTVGTWELGVRLQSGRIVTFGSLIFKGTSDGSLVCSILSPADRLHRGY